ncbi:ribbon-helix-helix domain-containing protein [Bacillus paranthracis]|uniref:ribbon-helix-helix domain-containing protein n=1 Tax=Bacillus paranthracis TaxID=2026186 RepID=UPI001E3E834D|nr:ribbon-helix-helix domain-containing protein [Bacillus paranthracis]MCC2441991.1 ribbon-helix-helix domain-containing protein [Bacillus paranthracis]MCD1182183.1 hypothetical protein [Bacillus paranthracis]MDK7418670.1 ribbon-helix-helix domain-containing protein [Bacillus paranthracis]MDK7430211.1 ribbon-helix-helix domain-containing protein [Bacillus paranthracis]MDK7518982.1 ribbon-helix-helix domain-containing protein [Bacillus paranthracis]
MAVDKTKNTQVLVTFPNEMLKQVDEYWHDNRFKNRNEAIRELIRISLTQKETQK